MGDDEYTPSPNYFSTTFTNNGGARSSSSRPIHKLSVKLVDTYKRINTVSFVPINNNICIYSSFIYYNSMTFYLDILRRKSQEIKRAS